MKQLLAELRSLQDEMINIVSNVSDTDYVKQFHPDLSPLGWHLGHCVYTEIYWIQEQLLGKLTVSDQLKSIYVPELSLKQSRGTTLPSKVELLAWAKSMQAENRNLLDKTIRESLSHKLLENDYLFHFLIQHYSQHSETMMMVLTEKQLQRNDLRTLEKNELVSRQHKKELLTIESGKYSIGITENNFGYDNEQPAHSIELDAFTIDTYPITNSDYLLFMNSGAYTQKEFWTDAAWQWLSKAQILHPYHWRRESNGTWFGIDNISTHSLKENDPIYGINYFEATAYASWAGGRLPHEYEWEVANAKKQLQNTGQAWEWCNNTFHPYKGFEAYPYIGYSSPYFDKQHYVLKGGGAYTKNHIKRPSFRNYYTAEKRHIFAGLRLVYD